MKDNEDIVEFKDLKIPHNYINNFEGYDDFSISKKEKNILFDLRNFSDSKCVEAIKVVYEGGESKITSSYLFGRVKIPISIKDKKHVKLYHSHTDISSFSKNDLYCMSNKNVDAIFVVNLAYYIFAISASNCVRPSIEEIDTMYTNIRNEVGQDIVDGNYGTMSMSERNYVLIIETMYRICRYYKWKIQGGRLYE